MNLIMKKNHRQELINFRTGNDSALQCGNIGWQVSKWGMLNQIEFWPNINIGTQRKLLYFANTRTCQAVKNWPSLKCWKKWKLTLKIKFYSPIFSACILLAIIQLILYPPLGNLTTHYTIMYNYRELVPNLSDTFITNYHTKCINHALTHVDNTPLT